MTDDNPLNPEAAELEVLAAAWHNPALLTTLDLTPSDFHNLHHEALWHTLTTLHTEGLTPDPILVLQRTPKQFRNATNNILIGTPTRPSITTDPGIPSNTEIHANTIRDRAQRRHLFSLMDGARQQLTNPDIPIGAALDQLATTLTEHGDTHLDAHTHAVQQRANKLRIERDARALLAAEQQPNTQDPDAGTLAQILARPPEPPHRAEGLVPSDASVLITAQRKTGKTTLTLNYARCLLTGEHFLGRFPVRPTTGNVAILNFEVSGAQLARWAHDVGIPEDRLWIENLRGRRNPLAHPDDRQALAQRLQNHNTEALIVDPFGRAYNGISQNDAGEVGAWLVDLDRLARQEAGATDLILTTHAGWNGERTRGSSALEDWADAIITLTRDEQTDERYIRAMGRDVELEEDRIVYDPATRWLSLTGDGNRKAAAESRRIDDLVPVVIQIVTDNASGISAYKITKMLRDQGANFQNGDEYKALTKAVEQGELTMQKGARNAQIYRPNPHLPAPLRDLSAERSVDLPDLSYRGRGGQTGHIGKVTSPKDHTTPKAENIDPHAKTCTTCGEPMTDLGDGNTTHPTCEPIPATHNPPTHPDTPTVDEPPSWLLGDTEPPF